MKTTIDQSLLDLIPIGGPIFDFTFSDNWIDNTGIFHNCYALGEDCTMGCASIVRLGVYLSKQNYFN